MSKIASFTVVTSPEFPDTALAIKNPHHRTTSEDPMPTHEGWILALARERDALLKFKSYVHGVLDSAGVPVDPPGAHRDAGCRVGQRLEFLLAKLKEAKQNGG